MELKYATVLVVDDESMLLDIFCEWLEEDAVATAPTTATGAL